MTNTRRSFLGGLTGVAAGLTYSSSAAATPQQLRQLLAVNLSHENYWNQVASQFPLRPGKIPMNAANLCPSPRVVSERVAELTRDEDADCSNPNRAKFAALLEESRQKVAGQIGVSPDEVALVRNTSEANNVINNGIALSAGDEVVLWEQNHPCNNAAWDVRAARHGFKIKRVAVPPAPGISPIPTSGRRIAVSGAARTRPAKADSSIPAPTQAPCSSWRNTTMAGSSSTSPTTVCGSHRRASPPRAAAGCRSCAR